MKLERKYGKYAIPNLMYYVIILYIVGFVINIVAPELYTEYLALDAQAILHGQIWRIFTFIIQPPNSSYFFILFALYLYYMIGKTLEYMWGAFRFNLYFFSGMLLHVIACLLIYLIFGMNFQMGSFYLNMSLFFVYVALFPDAEFLLFFIIPIKAKWLGIIEGAYFAITIAAGFIVPVGSTLWFSLLQAGIMALPANSISALLSLLNFIIFFLGSNRNRFSPKQARRRTYIRKKYMWHLKIIHIIAAQFADERRKMMRIWNSVSVPNVKAIMKYCQDHSCSPHEHQKITVYVIRR